MSELEEKLCYSKAMDKGNARQILIKTRQFVGFALGALLMVFAATHQAIAAPNPFLTMHQIDSADISAFTKWTSLIPRYEAQRKDAAKACVEKKCVSQEWENLLTKLAAQPANEQIAQVNDFFNAIRYVSDQENYGIADYWQTPYELMQRGGDCEDYAIAKYISLRRLGFAEQDMRLIIVKDDQLGGIIHAVLEVTIAEGSFILDNQDKQVTRAAELDHYRPVFAINESKWWAFRK